MVAKTLRMKKASSVRKMARNTLSIDVGSAVLSDAQPHRDCATWWSRPNLFSVGVEDRLILGRYTLVGSQSAACSGVDAAGLGVLFERSIKLPDPVARALDQSVLLGCRTGNLLALSLGMDPASGMVADGKLRGAITDDDHALEQALLDDGSP